MYFARHILTKLKTLNVRLTGVIIKIEGVGYSFLPGANFREVEESSQRCAILAPQQSFTPIKEVVNWQAKEIMAFIHGKNTEDKLPGVLTHFESVEKEAA